MARKPNYSFERKERERLKAEKLAEKAAAKRQQRESEMADVEQGQPGDSDVAAPEPDDQA